MSFGVNNIEKISGQKPRVFRLKPITEFPGVVRLREGMSLAKAAEKLNLKEESLALFGISVSGIDTGKLKETLSNKVPAGFSVRKEAGEEFTHENVFRAIIGRLGDEEDVFEPLDPDLILKTKGTSAKLKAAIIESRQLVTRTQEEECESVVEMIEQEQLGSFKEQCEIICEYAKIKHGQNFGLLSGFMGKLIKRLYPDNYFVYGQFIGLATYSVNFNSQEEANRFVDLLRTVLSPQDQILQKTLLAGMIRGISQSNPQSKEIFKTELALMIGEIMSMMNIVPSEDRLPPIIEFIKMFSADPVYQGEIAGLIAKKIFSDPQRQQEFIKRITRELFPPAALDLFGFKSKFMTGAGGKSNC
ncbi:MAG: hypothetical protein PHH14_00450 [Candidatus Margulisbacteria bacterium]|nr:hypothetical protein [Candidatus Margulisiibacteriota bacterium]